MSRCDELRKQHPVSFRARFSLKKNQTFYVRPSKIVMLNRRMRCDRCGHRMYWEGKDWYCDTCEHDAIMKEWESIR